MAGNLPTEPGVYRGVYSKDVGTKKPMTITVQLAEDGSWWPYPYIFSGWREVELRGFDFFPIVGAEMDVPEIRNPEKAALVEYLKAKLMTLSGVKEEEAEALARDLVLNHGFAAV